MVMIVENYPKFKQHLVNVVLKFSELHVELGREFIVIGVSMLLSTSLSSMQFTCRPEVLKVVL